MRIIRWLPALLLGLVLGQFASAADPSVMLTICNAGKVDLDAYLIRPGSALTTHVASAKCAVLEKVEGPAKPGTIGFGFTDTKGQWGGVRRTEVWPDSINSAFEPTKQTLTVKHGAANASIAGLVSYTSAAPYCAQTQSTTAPRAPATTTAGRIADAKLHNALWMSFFERWAGDSGRNVPDFSWVETMVILVCFNSREIKAAC